MKSIIIILSMVAGLSGTILNYVAANQPNDNEYCGTSWANYCKRYCVNVDNPTEEEYNYYLDCYCGSTEEDEDMNNY